MSDMQSAASSGSSTLIETPSMSVADLAALARSQAQTIAVQDEKITALEHQIEWFRRQIFGQKSERRPRARSIADALGPDLPGARRGGRGT
jgi:hypothetical protein